MSETKIALVTGANKGIGYAIASGLGALGYRVAVGALQGLDPDRVIYAGSASKTLAPALRIGWLVVPPSLLQAVSHEKLLADRGTARIEQHGTDAFSGHITVTAFAKHTMSA